ncbi:hypothetical protein JK386_03035 [Nocardioides sp. zg-536]|uniref:Uncharacterized protein n=1 Tax=Nocardioides faecalis TaxID=2803858 RepID=A0A939BUU7_9ACTN|nr:hypothetical protein [Nocardioides faecalis]MBM9458862.1 hypothetical protein [Nocardioides faecalis]QVI60268.1 hypothetical protein KG111_08295 [Nocardioides faecalis]
MDCEELAGYAARHMVAQDARWTADLVLSLQESGRSGWLSLVALGVSSRIVYEGGLAVKSDNPHVGAPALAAELDRDYDRTIARSRHGGKFLDDSQRPLPDLKTEILAFYAAHQSEFLGNSVWFARWFESDIGMCLGPGKRVLTSSITGHFRMGLESQIRVSDASQDSFDLAKSQGATLAVLARFAGDEAEPRASMNLSSLGAVTDIDRRADRYLSKRYDPAMDIATKLILLMIEAELNSNRLLTAEATDEHRESAFRARVVSLFHSLRAIDEILTKTPEANAAGSVNLRSLMADPAMRRWLNEKPLRLVRNRCVHYEIRQPILGLDASLPMFGIVEAQSPEDTFDSLNDEAVKAAERLGDAIHHWTS